MKSRSPKSRRPNPSQQLKLKMPGTPPGKRAERLRSHSREAAGAINPKAQRAPQRSGRGATRESARQMQALVSSLDDIIIEMDAQGTYLNLWTGNEGLLVKPKAEMLGHRVAEFLGEELSRKLLESASRVLASGQYEDVEYPLVVQGGRRWFLARLSDVVTPGAGARSVCMVVRDITGRKKAEEALVAANKELLFQNEEKAKRAAELVIANRELLFQSEEKEKRAAELVIANKELVLQSEEKEKRTAELSRISLETARRLQHIQALHSIDQAISGSFDLRISLKVLLDHAVEELDVDAASVLLLEPHTQTLHYAAGQGFRTREIEKGQLRVGEGQSGRAALERLTLTTSDLAGTDFGRSPLIINEGFVSHCAVPLITKGRVQGVLEIFQRSRMNPEPEWLELMETLAGQAAIAIDSVQLFDALERSNIELSQAYDATIDGWSQALDLRDKEIEGHTQRVTEMTMRLARAMGIGEAELVHVRRGALLHDIGKMGVSDAVLLKPGPLTDDEWKEMRTHPGVAHDLISQVAYLKPAMDIPYCHHEKWDGTGYPRGLKGEQIPLAARIFAVVDVWDALTSDRPYRRAWSQAKAWEYVFSESGKHFDPGVVEAFSALKAAEGKG